MYVGVAGQYWQSVKAYSGSVGLSYLAAQRRDCEETDAVNALASLSVGVLSNKRYSTHTHTRSCNEAKTKIHTFTLHGSTNSCSTPLTSVFHRLLQPPWRANGAWQRLHVEETDQSPHFQDLGLTCSLGSSALSHDHEVDAFVIPLRPTHLPYSHTCTSTNTQCWPAVWAPQCW